MTDRQARGLDRLARGSRHGAEAGPGRRAGLDHALPATAAGRAALHRPHRTGRAPRGGGQEGRLPRLEGPRRDVGDGVHARRRADVTTRPITFVFNGGPGSSSIWLHMGLLGPRRVDVGDVAAPHPPPYRLVDNAETLLAASDLVFIDPMSTGHTRAVEGGKPKELPRLRQGRGAGHRADPAVVHPRGPLDVAEVHHRRVLRHRARGRRRRAPGLAARDGAQRHRAGLQRARLRQPGLRAPPRRRVVPELPADVHLDRALPRQGQGPGGQAPGRGRGVLGRPVPRSRSPPGAGCRPRSGPRSCARWPG